MLLKPINSHSSHHLKGVFHSCFYEDYRTRLVGDVDEPLYQPETIENPATIYYRHDYFASALHEIAHWCIAGQERREKEDYGYWYVADGRDLTQQKAFLRAEVKPQALEWAFSVAAHYPFDVSLDNLEAAPENESWDYWQQQKQLKQDFINDCNNQLGCWFKQGFPVRAQKFLRALCDNYRDGSLIKLSDFRSNKWG